MIKVGLDKMPLYENHCDNCNHTWETLQTYLAEPVNVCEVCGNNNVRRVYSISHIVGCQKETLGKLAERNTKKMGGSAGEQIQKMANERSGSVSSFKGKLPEGAAENKRPVNRPGPDMSLNRLTPQQKDHYILTGKRPPV